MYRSSIHQALKLPIESHVTYFLREASAYGVQHVFVVAINQKLAAAF